MYTGIRRDRDRMQSVHPVRTAGVVICASTVLVAAVACSSSSGSQNQAQASTTLSGSAVPSQSGAAPTEIPAPTFAVPSTVAPGQTHSAAAANPPAGAPCQTGAVKVAATGSNSGAGTQVERFLITNVGSASCTMQSYPGVSLYGPMPQGGSTVEADLPLTVKPIPSDFGDLGSPGGLVTLQPGGTAAFFVKWSDVPTGSKACPTGDGFSFTTPQDSSHQVLITFAFGAVCGTTAYDSQIFPPSVTG